MGLAEIVQDTQIERVRREREDVVLCRTAFPVVFLYQLIVLKIMFPLATYTLQVNRVITPLLSV